MEDNLLNLSNAQFKSIQGDLKILEIEINSRGELKELKETYKATPCDVAAYVPTRIPENIHMISWNIDGHDIVGHLGKRSKAIVDLILKEQYDIILLQDMQALNFNYMNSRLNDKYMIVREEDCSFSWKVTLLKKETVKYESHKIIWFSRTNINQHRSILFTEVSVGSARLDILNVHFENMGKQFANIRLAQLQKCIQIASATEKEKNVIIGGDLNMREWEVANVYVPKTICDLWVQQGSNSSDEFTWDLSVNKNSKIPGYFKPRTRFDRFLFKSSTPQTLKPEFFGTAGKEKLPDFNVKLYPSVHWSIIAKLALLESARSIAMPVSVSTTEKAFSNLKLDDKMELEGAHGSSDKTVVKDYWDDSSDDDDD